MHHITGNDFIYSNKWFLTILLVPSGDLSLAVFCCCCKWCCDNRLFWCSANMTVLVTVTSVWTWVTGSPLTDMLPGITLSFLLPTQLFTVESNYSIMKLNDPVLLQIGLHSQRASS
jgi:hypothetical protein